jgi:hypothetical protein
MEGRRKGREGLNERSLRRTAEDKHQSADSAMAYSRREEASGGDARSCGVGCDSLTPPSSAMIAFLLRRAIVLKEPPTKKNANIRDGEQFNSGAEDARATLTRRADERTRADRRWKTKKLKLAMVLASSVIYPAPRLALLTACRRTSRRVRLKYSPHPAS